MITDIERSIEASQQIMAEAGCILQDILAHDQRRELAMKELAEANLHQAKVISILAGQITLGQRQVDIARQEVAVAAQCNQKLFSQVQDLTSQLATKHETIGALQAELLQRSATDAPIQ